MGFLPNPLEDDTGGAVQVFEDSGFPLETTLVELF